jgi:hypothetical protein
MSDESLCYRAILRILRDPDQAQDTFQDFALQKLLQPAFQRRLNDLTDERRVPYLYRCAVNFARERRRQLARDRKKFDALDPAQPHRDPRATLAGEIAQRLDYERGFAELARHSGEILAQLAGHGNGKEWVRTIIAYARGRGLTDLQTLLLVYSAAYHGWDPPQRLPPAGNSGCRLVRAHRLRARLRRLEPFVRGDVPWPSRLRI